MKPRMNFYRAAPDAIKALVAVESQVTASGLEQSLIELVKTRASQINGCAYCVDLHWRDLIKQDAEPRRLNALVAWEESPFFTDKERALLVAWFEGAGK